MQVVFPILDHFHWHRIMFVLPLKKLNLKSLDEAHEISKSNSPLSVALLSLGSTYKW